MHSFYFLVGDKKGAHQRHRYAGYKLQNASEDNDIKWAFKLSAYMVVPFPIAIVRIFRPNGRMDLIFCRHYLFFSHLPFIQTWLASVVFTFSYKWQYCGGSIFFWIPEILFCGHLQPLQLHAWFHLTSAVGSYSFVVFIAGVQVIRGFGFRVFGHEIADLRRDISFGAESIYFMCTLHGMKLCEFARKRVRHVGSCETSTGGHSCEKSSITSKPKLLSASSFRSWIFRQIF